MGRDRLVEERYAWRQRLNLVFPGNAVMGGTSVEAELLMHVVKARAMTSAGAVMVFSE